MRTLKKLHWLVWITLINIFCNQFVFAQSSIQSIQRHQTQGVSDTNQLVVLQYHHVAEDTPDITSIKPTMFLAHLNYLSDNQFNVVDLPWALAQLKSGKTLPAKAVAITFDDGYKNLADMALPELAKRNWPATIFVNPGLLDKHKTHYLSWQQLKDWQQKKMTIANHGWLHDYWVRPNSNFSAKQWQAEVKKSILDTEQALIKHLGKTPKLIAYPYGEYDSWLKEWLITQKLVAFGQQSGVVASYSDFSALPRYPASGQYANLETLSVKLNSMALPIDYKQLPSPLLASVNNPPPLKLTWLDSVKSTVNSQQLACYVTGQTLAKIKNQTDQVEVQAQQVLSQGRTRYNCTLPVGDGRFYWFSQPWLVLER